VSREYLWYIPNTVLSGHRGDDTVDGWGSLEYSAELAQCAEQHGWGGALIGAGWGRADSFTIATAIAARTTTFAPLVAIRPGYWNPAHFASAAPSRPPASETTENLPGAAAMTCAHERPIEPVAPKIDRRLAGRASCGRNDRVRTPAATLIIETIRRR